MADAAAERQTLGANVRALIADIRASVTEDGAKGTPAQRSLVTGYRNQADALLEQDLDDREVGVQRLYDSLVTYGAWLATVPAAPGDDDDIAVAPIFFHFL